MTEQEIRANEDAIYERLTAHLDAINELLRRVVAAENKVAGLETRVQDPDKLCEFLKDALRCRGVELRDPDAKPRVVFEKMLPDGTRVKAVDRPQAPLGGVNDLGVHVQEAGFGGLLAEICSRIIALEERVGMVVDRR